DIVTILRNILHLLRAGHQPKVFCNNRLRSVRSGASSLDQFSWLSLAFAAGNTPSMRETPHSTAEFLNQVYCAVASPARTDIGPKQPILTGRCAIRTNLTPANR